MGTTGQKIRNKKLLKSSTDLSRSYGLELSEPAVFGCRVLTAVAGLPPQPVPGIHVEVHIGVVLYVRDHGVSGLEQGIVGKQDDGVLLQVVVDHVIKHLLFLPSLPLGCPTQLSDVQGKHVETDDKSWPRRQQQFDLYSIDDLMDN